MTEGAGRRTPYGLIVSLCLNFFLIGLIVAGLVIARMRGGTLAELRAPGMGGPGAMSPMAVLDALPLAGQQKFCRVLFKYAPEARQWAKRGAEGRRMMFEALRQTPFDNAGFKSGASVVAEAQRGFVTMREKVVIETAEQLSAEEIETLAQAAVRRASGRRRGVEGAGETQDGEGLGLARRCRSLGVTPL